MTRCRTVAAGDPVSFCAGGERVCGHVAKSGARSATVVASDGREYRVHLSALTPDSAGRRRPVETKADVFRVRFPAGCSVSWTDSTGRRCCGSVSGQGPQRALVTDEEGVSWRIPYGLLAGGTDESRAKDGSERLARIREEAGELMRAHKLRDWIFRFDGASRRAGSCNYRGKFITVAQEFALKAPDGDVRDTILHEIAHALAGAKAGHGPVWQAIARDIGCSSRRCHDIKFSQSRWICSCKACGWSEGRMRRIRGAACRTCGGAVSWEAPAGEA